MSASLLFSSSDLKQNPSLHWLLTLPLKKRWVQILHCPIPQEKERERAPSGAQLVPLGLRIYSPSVFWLHQLWRLPVHSPGDLDIPRLNIPPGDLSIPWENIPPGELNYCPLGSRTLSCSCFPWTKRTWESPWGPGRTMMAVSEAWRACRCLRSFLRNI